MTHYFVTGTGTDVGKTYVLTHLLRYLNKSFPVMGYKPVISGFESVEQGNDSRLLLQSINQPVEIESVAAISPFRYRAPLSPHISAQLEQKTLCYESLVEFCQDKIRRHPSCFFEGVGGVKVPLTFSKTVLDWMQDMAIPVILVANTALGSMSHTLCALSVLEQAGLSVHAVVISQSEQCVGLEAMETTIASFSAVPVYAWPRGEVNPPRSLIERLTECAG